MTYKLSKAADRDLKRLFKASLVQFGRLQADVYYDGVVGTLNALAERPLMARERGEYGAGICMHPYRSHVIVYRVVRLDIQIVRILHGRQDLPEHI